MKEILKSKVMIAFIVFVLAMTYMNASATKNVSAENTDKNININKNLHA